MHSCTRDGKSILSHEGSPEVGWKGVGCDGLMLPAMEDWECDTHARSLPNCLPTLHNPCNPCVTFNPCHMLIPAPPPLCSPGSREQMPMPVLMKCPSCLLCLLKPHFSFKVYSKRQLLCGTFPDLPQTKYPNLVLLVPLLTHLVYSTLCCGWLNICLTFSGGR